jgi:hypothetical protein
VSILETDIAVALIIYSFFLLTILIKYLIDKNQKKNSNMVLKRYWKEPKKPEPRRRIPESPGLDPDKKEEKEEGEKAENKEEPPKSWKEEKFD